VSQIRAARACRDRPDQLLIVRHGPLPQPPSKPEQRGACAKPGFRGERWIAAFHRITTSRSGDRPAGRVRGSRAAGIYQEDLASMAPQAQWIHSFVPDGKIYCLYLADNAETIREHARRGGFPADHVALVRALIDPVTGETSLAGE
jgi:hypothetical protein